jgi:hypothetical protein
MAAPDDLGERWHGEIGGAHEDEAEGHWVGPDNQTIG